MARTQKQPCGCKYKDQRVLEMCPACTTEWDETTARVAEEHKNRPWPSDRRENEESLR